MTLIKEEKPKEILRETKILECKRNKRNDTFSSFPYVRRPQRKMDDAGSKGGKGKEM